MDSASRLSAQASDVVTARPASFRPDIQGLRAVAVILVMLDHASWLSAGFVGVDVFFVISGFVITGLLIRELSEHGAIRYGRFYVRRAFRLLPAAALVSLVSFLVAIVLLSPFGQQQQAGGTGATASVWLANMALWRFTGGYFDQNVSWNPFLHYWSLSVEEQFYFVFPWVIGGVVWAARKSSKVKRSPLPWIAGLIGVGTLLSFGAMCYLSYANPSEVLRPLSLSFYSGPTRAWEFGIGALLSLFMQGNPRFGPRTSNAACVAGMAALLASMFAIDPSVVWPGVRTLLPVLGVGLLILGGRDAQLGNRGLNSPLVVRLGDASYSLYLWHWPLLVAASKLSGGSLLATALAVVLTFPISLWCYDHVEQRYRGSYSQWSRQSVCRVATMVALPVILGLSIFVGSLNYWGLSQFSMVGQDVVPNAEGFETCLAHTMLSDRQGQDCRWNADASGIPVYLVGDSNAMMYSDALIPATRDLDHPLFIGTQAGCAPFPVGNLDQGCGAWALDARNWLSSQEPGVVYLAWSGEQALGRGEDSVGVWGQSARSTVTQLIAAGHRVVVIQVIPHPAGSLHRWWDAADCSNMSVILDPTSCTTSVDLLAESGRQESALLINESTADVGAEILDLRQQLCPQGICSTRGTSYWVYRDGMHLSVTGAQSLAQVFEVNLDSQSLEAGSLADRGLNGRGAR